MRKPRVHFRKATGGSACGRERGSNRNRYVLLKFTRDRRRVTCDNCQRSYAIKKRKGRKRP